MQKNIKSAMKVIHKTCALYSSLLKSWEEQTKIQVMPYVKWIRIRANVKIIIYNNFGFILFLNMASEDLSHMDHFYVIFELLKSQSLFTLCIENNVIWVSHPF